MLLFEILFGLHSLQGICLILRRQEARVGFPHTPWAQKWCGLGLSNPCATSYYLQVFPAWGKPAGQDAGEEGGGRRAARRSQRMAAYRPKTQTVSPLTGVLDSQLQTSRDNNFESLQRAYCVPGPCQAFLLDYLRAVITLKMHFHLILQVTEVQNIK